MQEATKAQTFVVQSMLDGTRAEIGSGVVVRREGDVLTIATAAHVVRRPQSLRILDASRQSYYDVIDVRAISGYDLALVRVRAKKTFPVQPAPFARATVGEAVWVWGNPADTFWTLSAGTVQTVDTQLPNQSGAPRITIVCASCSYGDSGAGVFSNDGKLVGILSAGWRDRAGTVRFVQVEPITPIAQEVLAESER